MTLPQFQIHTHRLTEIVRNMLRDSKDIDCMKNMPKQNATQIEDTFITMLSAQQIERSYIFIGEKSVVF